MEEAVKYKDLSLTDIDRLFSYDRDTGILKWKVSSREVGFGRFNCGDAVGVIHTSGHLTAKIYNLSYEVHRIIFFGCHGYVPKRIKHINNDLLDNRADNLRDADIRQITDAELLKEYLRYDPDSGLMYWIKRKSGVKVGNVAGCVDKSSGYIRMYFNGRIYYIHQLIWLYMTGNWSDREIDHINLNKADNRWCNLREALPAENCWNKAVRSDNTSGVKGVTWDRTLNLWRGSVSIHNTVYRASFHSKDAAAEWVTTMREQLHKEYVRHE